MRSALVKASENVEPARVGFRAWCAVVAISFLAACASAPASPAPAVTDAARGSSSDTDYLYVSDWMDGRIDVFTYPAGTLAASISDTQYPLGLCSDANGDVWVTNFNAGSDQIVEYAHGGTTPIATRDDPNAEPRGCAVDSKTGNLAVVNGEPGNVVVYPPGSETPTYFDPHIAYPFACTYDGAGNLYVDGYRLHDGDHFGLTELLRGRAAFDRVRVTAQLGLPGDLQWDGKDLAIGDYSSPGVIYRLHVFPSKKRSQLEATIALAGPVRQPPDGVQFWLQDGVLIMPFGDQKRVNKIGMWSYPAGGTSTGMLDQFKAGQLYGVTVSVPPAR